MLQLRARFFGLGMIAAGLGCAWFFGLQPLWEAQAHRVTEIRVDMRLFFVAPMAILSGLAMLIGGQRVAEAFAGPPRNAGDHALLWPLMILTFGSSFLAWQWMDAQLAAAGFR